MYKFWIKNCTQKCTFCPEKTKKNYFLKIEVFTKTFDQNVQILDKNRSFVPKNVHLVLKNQKHFTFYSKNEVFAKIFLQNVQIFDKRVVLYPKMYISF